MEEKSSALEKLYDETMERVSNFRKYLLGRTLTIIDSSMPDPEQRKAAKDIVNDLFWGREYYTDGVKREFIKFAEAKKMKFQRSDLPSTVEADGGMPNAYLEE